MGVKSRKTLLLTDRGIWFVAEPQTREGGQEYCTDFELRIQRAPLYPEGFGSPTSRKIFRVDQWTVSENHSENGKLARAFVDWRRPGFIFPQPKLKPS